MKEALLPDLLYRASSLGNLSGSAPATFDRASRSVGVTIATQAPVMMWDWDYGEIPETLLMKGCQLPKSRQIPLLDTHSRYSTSDQIGSVRQLRIEGEELAGRQVYSSVQKAEDAFTKVEEGHLTDNSVGYRINDFTTVRKGESQTIAGLVFKGPHRVVTSWTPKEDSICPIGADMNAKFRAEMEARHSRLIRLETMDLTLRKFLEANGLSRRANETEAWEFYLKISHQR